jgi:hypothetical protein
MFSLHSRCAVRVLISATRIASAYRVTLESAGRGSVQLRHCRASALADLSGFPSPSVKSNVIAYSMLVLVLE